MIYICTAWWTSTNTFGPLYWCLPYRLVRGAHSVLISYHFPQQALWILDASLHPSKYYLGIFAHTCIATFTGDITCIQNWTSGKSASEMFFVDIDIDRKRKWWLYLYYIMVILQCTINIKHAKKSLYIDQDHIPYF